MFIVSVRMCGWVARQREAWPEGLVIVSLASTVVTRLGLLCCYLSSLCKKALCWHFKVVGGGQPLGEGSVNTGTSRTLTGDSRLPCCFV